KPEWAWAPDPKSGAARPGAGGRCGRLLDDRGAMLVNGLGHSLKRGYTSIVVGPKYADITRLNGGKLGDKQTTTTFGFLDVVIDQLLRGRTGRTHQSSM